MDKNWSVELFKKSILKKTKFNEITSLLGSTEHLHCLDIGSDNGVISYLFRQQAGNWKSADLDFRSVAAMRELVQTEVYQIDGGPTPFDTDEFDCVIIVDFLEHIPDEKGFLADIYRVLKPGGTLILNAPNLKNGWLMKFREAIGLTEESHGHLRPGYSIDSIINLLGADFRLEKFRTYTKFFSKFMDTLMVFALIKLKKSRDDGGSGRGVLVTGKEMRDYKKIFRLYSIIYPFVWLFSQLDKLLVFTDGYMLIAKARSNKAKNNAQAEVGDVLLAEKQIVA